LKGNKATDNRGYPKGTERARYVINIRPEPQLTVDPGVGSRASCFCCKLQAASYKLLDTKI